MNIKRMVPLIIILLLSLSSCQPLGKSDSAATPAPAMTSDSQTETKTPEVIDPTPAGTPEKVEIYVEGDVSFGPGSFNYMNPMAGLSELASYTAVLRLSFDGTEAGQPSQWTKTYTMLTSLKPAARQLTINSTGQTEAPAAEYMAEVDGTAYTQRDGGACSARSPDPAESLSEQMEPASFLTGMIGAEEAGIETINGATANHYTFDEEALGLTGIAKANGEIWVSADGGYLVKYLLTTQGGADYFGTDIEGTVTWDYELTGANQPATFMLPDDCPGGMITAPRLPNAADLQDEPGFVSYITTSSPAEAAAFYQNELPLLGWSAGEPIVSETMAVQYFSKEDQQLTLIITGGIDGTTVQLLLGPA